jgi:hypothetical protein
MVYALHFYAGALLKNMNYQKHIIELEALADLMIEKAMAIKMQCHKTRTTAGVSTPASLKKAEIKKMALAAVNKRLARIKEKTLNGN